MSVPDAPSSVCKASPGRPIPRGWAFLAACLGVGLSSGGLILGTGPFVSQAIGEGYLNGSDVSTVFDGAFQIMTWGTAVAAHLNDRVGPRLTALMGCCLALVGHGTFLSLTAKPTPYPVLLVAYGLVGWGGNMIFISSFHFARLFPENVARADGVFTGLFNVCGLWFLLWNIPALGLKALFATWFGVVCALAVLILVVYPDTPYGMGDRAVLSMPSLSHVKNPFSLSPYRSTLGDLMDSRYWLYAFTFGLSVCYSLYLQGELVGGLFDGAFPDKDAAHVFVNWAYPLTVNSVILVSWAVGWSIDRQGFVVVGLVQALACSLCMVLGLLAESEVAAWLALFAVLFVHALQYTIEWAFLHRALRQEAFPVASLVMLVVQGLLGFIVWPILTPNPWGDHAKQPFWMFLFASVLLYVWPLAEHCVYSKRPAVSHAPLRGAGSFASTSFVGKGQQVQGQDPLVKS